MRIHRGSKVPGCLGGFSLIPAHRQVPGDAGGWWILVDWDDSHGPKSSPWVMVKCDVDRRGSSMIILAMGLSSCRPCGSWSQGVSAGAPTKVKATALIFSVLGFLYNLISGCMHNCNCCVSP